ncbi:Structural maintenance of chromosomes protein 3 [Yamadazyma tenuis]|nr:Structural maintenance of chromosomes protein 3 [Yamadazyma tenuis]
MYIKRIVVQGFKTYKNKTVIDLVSPKFNVVVGRNGSGKSNFFSAIRFVLSDAYTHMSREERQGLIHEGSGTVMSAYVEIIFDNTDRRLPISKDEVSIRRTIGLKKDDYSLDGKSATRSDIMNLLESSGFSRSNPYYIVPQGKITALTNSKDSERLNLLKDVSGAKVFELKLKESLKEMDNSTLKRRRIDEALDSINERLTDLQLESNDLKSFQELDKSRKILEFNLFDRELNELTYEVEKIDLKYQEHLEKTTDDLKILEDGEKVVKNVSDEIKDLKTNMKLINLEKDQNQLYYNQLLSEISQKEVQLDDLQNDMEQANSHSESLINNIKHYQGLVVKTKENISKLKPELKLLHDDESSVKQKLTELTTKQRSIFSKQSRFQKFSSKKERDQWLKGEIKRISKDLRTKNAEFKRLNEQITDRKEQILEVDNKSEELNTLINDEKFQEEVSEIQKAINNLKLGMSDASDQRKSLWRDEIRYKSVHDSLTNDLNNASNLVNQTMDRLQSQGLQAVNDISESLNLQDHVYGPLISLFNVSDKYKTAVEVIAGNALFHVVVDTDETASAIMEELIRRKVGRVTFIPLNRLNPPLDVTYPDFTENQCIPLIKKIKFNDSRITKAIQHLFSRTIVCNDLVKGAELSKALNLTAITLDGDKVDTRGALSGGYRDYKFSRIDAIKIQSRKKEELLQNESKLEEVVVKISEINNIITSLNNQLQTYIRDLDEKYSSIGPVKSEITQLKNKKSRLEQELNTFDSNLESITALKQNLSTNLQQYEEELASEFTQSLNDDELATLKSLSSEIDEQEDRLNKIVSKSTDIETTLNRYETELSINYRPHLEKLIGETNNPRSKLNDFEIDELKQELDRLNTQLQAIKVKNDTIMREFSRLSEQLTTKEVVLKNLNEKQLKLTEKLEKSTKQAERSLNKKAILSSRRDEINKKIREIGVLPEEAFDSEKYDKFESDELLTQLNETNTDLKKYNHINKKAIEQYDMFTSRHNDLEVRRQELDASKESIGNLITNLKLQKDQAITNSFKLVAQSFSEVFEKLVPNGTGKLIMQRKRATDQDDDEEMIDEEDAATEDAATEDVDMSSRTDINDYVGVSISVSFNSKYDEQQRIEQLSGGQKSLCAIALILAIQNCDPAPFYLFDEIDANLDTQYRTSVASMIHALSDRAQFICTTFRPEMLQVADKFYGVTFNNKVTTVSDITRNDATSFVEGQHQT